MVVGGGVGGVVALGVAGGGVVGVVQHNTEKPPAMHAHGPFVAVGGGVGGGVALGVFCVALVLGVFGTHELPAIDCKQFGKFHNTFIIV